MEILTRSVHEVISGEIVPNNLFLGKIATENIESHPWEAICFDKMVVILNSNYILVRM